MIVIRKFTQNEIEILFKSNNCELLDIYKDARTKMKYKCSCGETNYISLDNFKKGKRCKQCGLNKLANTFKHDIDYVRQYFIDNKCVPLFTEYKNTHIPLDYICECGEKSKIAFSDFQSGKRCNNCRMERIQKTMYKNGSQMCSGQQKYLHNILGGKLNYPLKNSSLDIAFPEDKIYFEYDGSGHDLSVKLGALTEEEFILKEKRRKYALYRQGWKEIRIISKKDKLPSKEKINEMKEYALAYFNTGHSWIIFDLDNSLIINKMSKMNYDYGNLKRLS